MHADFSKADRTISPSDSVKNGGHASLSVHVNFLGRFRVVCPNGVEIEWPGAKSRMLAAYLLYKKKPQHREVLMETFWPDKPYKQARNCLNATMHQIHVAARNACPGLKLFSVRVDHYAICEKVSIESDVQLFQLQIKLAARFEQEKRLSRMINCLETTIAYYGGDFMEDDLYERWVEEERSALQQAVIFALDKLSHYYSLDGKPDIAIPICCRLLQVDNCREDVHRRLMRCYYRIGQRSQAIRQFEVCRDVLKNELGVQPSQKAWQLLEKIKQK